MILVVAPGRTAPTMSCNVVVTIVTSSDLAKKVMKAVTDDTETMRKRDSKEHSRDGNLFSQQFYAILRALASSHTSTTRVPRKNPLMFEERHSVSYVVIINPTIIPINPRDTQGSAIARAVASRTYSLDRLPTRIDILSRSLYCGPAQRPRY